MESYNSMLKYFFPIFFLLQYVGCDSYRYNARNNESNISQDVAIDASCVDFDTTHYNGLFASIETGTLFVKNGKHAIDSIYVSKEPIVGFKEIEKVSKNVDLAGFPSVHVRLTEKGKETFKEHTLHHIGDKVAIIIHNKLISAPVISAQISGGSVEVSGNFTQDEADFLYQYLYRSIRCAKDN